VAKGTKKQSAIAQVKKRIVSVKDAEPYVKVCLFGKNGKGKTRTGATAPDCILLDCNEKGTKSIRNYPNVEVFHAKNWEDVVWFYWYLRSGEHEHKSFMVDTVTGMQALCMTQVLKESEDRDPAKDPKMASMRDYGKVNQLMKDMMLWMRNLPMHVVFIAQERTFDNDETGETERVPDLSPGSRATLTACVDFIGHIRSKEVRAVNKRTKKEVKKWRTIMLIGPHETYLTKDRSGVLPRFMVDPSIPAIIEAANTLEDE
jgi:hypothetical protein